MEYFGIIGFAWTMYLIYRVTILEDRVEKLEEQLKKE
mgnify:CR=1 FL=1